MTKILIPGISFPPISYRPIQSLLKSERFLDLADEGHSTFRYDWQCVQERHIQRNRFSESQLLVTQPRSRYFHDHDIPEH